MEGALEESEAIRLLADAQEEYEAALVALQDARVRARKPGAGASAKVGVVAAEARLRQASGRLTAAGRALQSVRNRSSRGRRMRSAPRAAPGGRRMPEPSEGGPSAPQESS